VGQNKTFLEGKGRKSSIGSHPYSATIALEHIQEWAWSGLRSSQFDFSLGLSKEHFIETVKNILRAKKVESDVEPVRKGHFGEPAAASCVFR
jgi:hypothetical protein